MAHTAPNKLIRIAQERGVDVHELIAPQIDEGVPVFGIAMNLGVYPNTIYYWLKRNGYIHLNGKWEKSEIKETAQHGN